MITKRDFEVIEFIRTYKVATTDTLYYFFYPSIRVAQNRLKVLADKKLLNRSRATINNQYVYSIKKINQLRHSLLVTDFYRELSKVSEVAFFTIEPQIAHFRPDAIFGYTVNGKDFIGLLEVEISHKGFDYFKYSDSNIVSSLPAKPKLFIVGDKINLTNKKIDFDFAIINTDFKGMRLAIR